jgi:hypothetical protein
MFYPFPYLRFLMFHSTKNTTSFWYSKNVKVENKLLYPFGSYPKQQISDLVVLAVPFSIRDILSSVSKGEYRFGMNTQEKDNEIYGEGNSYTAEYWQYDARLGRRWNVDPVVKVHESPYATFANNPIWFVDPSGAEAVFPDDKFGDQAKKDFNEAIDVIDFRISSLEKEKENLINSEGKKGKKYHRDLNSLNERLDDLKLIKNNFDEIKKSKIKFIYSTNTDGFSDNKLGRISANDPEGKVAYINFRPGNLGALVHENRHGLGLMKGEIGAFKEAYDYMDEYEAYMFQMIFDPVGVRAIMNDAQMSSTNPNVVNNPNFNIMDMVIELYKGTGIREKKVQEYDINSPYLKTHNSKK